MSTNKQDVKGTAQAFSDASAEGKAGAEATRVTSPGVRKALDAKYSVSGTLARSVRALTPNPTRWMGQGWSTAKGAASALKRGFSAPKIVSGTTDIRLVEPSNSGKEVFPGIFIVDEPSTTPDA